MRLSPTAVSLIEAAVEKIFARMKARFTGKVPPNTPKGLILSLRPEFSIPSIFKQAAKTEGVKSNEEVLAGLTKISNSYLDATKEKAKAKVVHKVQSFLTDAKNQGVDTDLETVLNGELVELWGSLKNDVKKIAETEIQTAKNFSLTDAITKINLTAGIRDPLVYWIIVRDGEVCDECLRLHCLDDGVTPRVWRMSEVGSGYHKKGDPSPKIAGLHPNCRCFMMTLLPGYGFDASGRIEYNTPGWDEHAHQH